jgi:hypothetical protein
MRGSLSIGSRVHLHWSLALGALLFCAAHPSWMLLFAFAAMIAVHALGHLALLLACGLRPSALVLHGLGAELPQPAATRERPTSPVESSLIAWGGVLAQGLLIIYALWRPLPHELEMAFVRLNGLVLALNLLPVAPLDGAEAWRIFPRLRARPRRAALPDPRRVQKDVQELLKKIRNPQ